MEAYANAGIGTPLQFTQPKMPRVRPSFASESNIHELAKKYELVADNTTVKSALITRAAALKPTPTNATVREAVTSESAVYVQTRSID